MNPVRILSTSTGSLLIPVWNAPMRDVFLAPAIISPASRRPPSKGHRSSDPATCRMAKRSSVYAVDDDENLTELYTLLLTGAGYEVRAFNHRTQALAALKLEVNKPQLLITDYFGLTMEVHQFMCACRVLH